MDHPSHDNSPERGTDRLTHRLGQFLLVAGAILVVDQVTKSIIRGWLHPGETWPAGWDLIRLAHVRNTGAAFGILQGAGDFLIVAGLVAIGAMTFYLLTLPAHSRWYTVALSAVLGGALGNLIDRVRLGHVTDFIDPTHYPAFNVADSAIVLGVIAIAVLAFLDERREAAGEPAPEEAGREAATTPPPAEESRP